ncbi:PRC-barrel domain-containing protein [Pseudooceanicola sp. HF7]|uniref:PRC-barrel domain-containing protein n=1 Tax=Pseudooceanicola sp. HF7 TaxID=2721560 RepID=UPI00142FBE0E|nr:PRC-barrel domain-containing protein [Pseudooceanicola sp. HF7]NIZ10476.1 hypothetical protein [Pseudooceanicola sp. HF7]
MTRFFKTTSSAALIAMLAAAPVAGFAQAADDATLVPESATEAPAENTDSQMNEDGSPMPEENIAETDDGTMPGGTMTDSATPESEMVEGAPVTDDPFAGDADANDMAETETPAKPVDGQITMQDEDTILAADLMGATVYTDDDVVVGDIDNLIIGLDGSVRGAVIGVGGFLGIGEKHVAVEMASLEVIADDEGNPRLFTSATKEDLTAAEEFVSVEDQAREAENASMQQSGTGMGTMDAAPVE